MHNLHQVEGYHYHLVEDSTPVPVISSGAPKHNVEHQLTMPHRTGTLLETIQLRAAVGSKTAGPAGLEFELKS